MIECKSSDEGVNDPSVFEASKFKEAYDAQFCALVGRAFSGEIAVSKELQNHGVSAWTVDDLTKLLRVGANPLEIKALFAPGFASDAVEISFGSAPTAALNACASLPMPSFARGSRLNRHTMAIHRKRREITEDVAMVLVDQDLAAQGSSATCSRAEVRAAIDYLPIRSLAWR